MLVLTSDATDLRRAAEILRDGGLVAFPTETVYGLGARADDPAAVAKIFAAKGRPADHPLIVHLPSAEAVAAWAKDVPRDALRLAERFWPGPLTIILRRAAGVPDAVTGGQDTVGLRVPGDPVARALLTTVGLGLAAPSANRFGRISPTTAQHVVAELEGRIDAVVDGGPCDVGLESTIVDLSGPTPRLLRPGAITVEALTEVLGRVPEPPDAAAPRVPGALASHYAPTTRLWLVDDVAVAVAKARRAGEVVVVGLGPPVTADARWVSMPDDPTAYAQRIYATLRDADTSDAATIIVQRPPPDPSWAAVLDRLQRAAHSHTSP